MILSAARVELRRKGIEILRYAARMISDNPDFDDPGIDKYMKITGEGETIVNTD